MVKCVKSSHRLSLLASLALALTTGLSSLPAFSAPLTTGGITESCNNGKMENISAVEKLPLQTADGKAYQITRTVVNAKPEDVFAILTDYSRSGLLFSNLTKSSVVSRDEQGKTSNVAFSLKGIMNLWSFDYILSIKENFPSSIEFHRVSGSFKRNEGYWSLQPLDSGRRTAVTYAKYIDAGMVVPPQIVAKQVHDSTQQVVDNLKKVAEDPKMKLASHG